MFEGEGFASVDRERVIVENRESRYVEEPGKENRVERERESMKGE